LTLLNPESLLSRLTLLNPESLLSRLMQRRAHPKNREQAPNRIALLRRQGPQKLQTASIPQAMITKQLGQGTLFQQKREKVKA